MGRAAPLLRRFAVALAALAFAAAPGVAHAGDYHFLLLFSAQRTPNLPSHSHSFATFVRASWPGNGPCPPAPALETCTISWMPQQVPLRIWALSPECGCNHDLPSTLQPALADGQRISLWGPYWVDGDLYRRATRQAAVLASGRVRYKTIDTGYRSGRVSNCVHALLGVVEESGTLVFTPGWGDAASPALLERFRPWVLDRRAVYPWVGTAVGLDRYPIVYRDWPCPAAGWQASYGPPRG